MRAIILLLVTVTTLAGCARTIQPLPPTSNALKSSYRKTVEVILVSCEKSRRYSEYISIVESSETGERFEVHGCYGKPGDRFKVSY